MRQRTPLFWPINIFVGFLLVVGLMLVSAAITPFTVLAIDPLRCPTNGPAEQPNPYPAYPVCLQTAGPLLTGTALAGNPPTNTATTQSTNNSNTNPNPNPAPTNTFTPTATATATVANDTDAATPTATRTPTPTAQAPRGVEDPVPSPTPTPLLPAGVETRVCVPGEPIEITGEGEAGTPLIVTFAGRPVGGGAVRSDGTYRMSLRVGSERPGLYLVEVEERDSRTVLQEFGCEIPALNGSPAPLPDRSPTPTPFAGNA